MAAGSVIVSRALNSAKLTKTTYSTCTNSSRNFSKNVSLLCRHLMRCLPSSIWIKAKSYLKQDYSSFSKSEMFLIEFQSAFKLSSKSLSQVSKRNFKNWLSNLRRRGRESLQRRQSWRETTIFLKQLSRLFLCQFFRARKACFQEFCWLIKIWWKVSRRKLSCRNLAVHLPLEA